MYCILYNNINIETLILILGFLLFCLSNLSICVCVCKFRVFFFLLFILCDGFQLVWHGIQQREWFDDYDDRYYEK